LKPKTSKWKKPSPVLLTSPARLGNDLAAAFCAGRVLTFRKGTSGAPTAAQAMAEHLREQTLPEEMVAMADYYLRGVKRAEVAGTAAIPRQNMPAGVAVVLGLDINRTATHEEVVNLLRGQRADGADLPGAQRKTAYKDRERITYVDFTFSAPKSVSIAMALAPTDAERHMIVGAHRDAWMAAMEYAETVVARARKGKGGSKGSVPGKLGWVSFDHYTARPTIEIPHTEVDGAKTTLIQTVRNPKVAGDMQLHTHVTTPNVVVCPDGTVGSMDMLAMHDRVHEIGAFYQAHLATNLRAHGIEVVLDERTESARLTAIPDSVCEVFSKRTRDGEGAARDYVASVGLDWDALHPMELAKVLKGGTRATRRQKETGQRGDDMSDLAAWKAQAEAAGYRHETVIRKNAKHRPLEPDSERLKRAYAASLPVLERQLSRRATMHATVARTAAARGLIAAGVESADDIDRITAAMREHGVRHDGQQVPLIWAHTDGQGEETSLDRRRPRIKITTTLHVEQEREAMALASAAAADRSGALLPAMIDRAVQIVAARDSLDFSAGHGLEQRRVIDVLGTSGRFAVAVGVAGAGKSTLLRPLVEAWGAQGRMVYGTALAWRQSDLLVDAGIERSHSLAIAALLARARAGQLLLNRNSVVVVDELSQVGTTQALALLRLQAQHGFTMVAIGDDRQAQAIEAGNTIGLLRRALGDGAVPELEATVRQIRDRDKGTSLLFRAGRAAEGIARLREDGHVILAQGGRTHAIEAAADLWEQRQAANAGREGYTLTVSAPTNSDARSISEAIRERRRRAGAVGPDEVTVDAADQHGVQYELRLAVGDRLRLFARTQASFGDRGGNIGHNGSVVEVERIADDGLQLRNAKGSSGFVKWDTLRARETGRIKLTYGDVITIDAIQSATSTEHLNVLPSGSQAVQSFKNYVAQSRARGITWLVVSDGRERSEIMTKRALGNVDPIGENDIWRNVAVNLSRQPEKELATDLLRHARTAHTGTVKSLAAAFQPKQQREAQGQEGTTLHRTFAAKQNERDASCAAASACQAAERCTAAAQKAVHAVQEPAREKVRQAVRDAPHRTKRTSPDVSPEDRARSQVRNMAKRTARDAERRRQETITARKALAVWNRAKPVREHPYLACKNVASYGLRQDRRGNLLVPMRDAAGRLWNLQTINANGRKLFMRGGWKQGMHALLGRLESGMPLVIAESYATAATMRDVTGFAVVAAFDSGNLMEVARAYRARDPARPIIIAANNDHHLPRRSAPLPNLGRERAVAAAEAVGGIVLLPSFAPADRGTDWNDFAAQRGKAAIRQVVEETLQTHGIVLPAKPASQIRATPTQAERNTARQRTKASQAGGGEDAATKAAQRQTQRPKGPRQ
jgi:phage/plasmid primase-like uncharacterized protein